MKPVILIETYVRKLNTHDVGYTAYSKSSKVLRQPSPVTAGFMTGDHQSLKHKAVILIETCVRKLNTHDVGYTVILMETP